MSTISAHHFYLVESAGDDVLRAQAILKEMGWTIEPARNFFVFSYDSFGIDDARQVRAQAILRGDEAHRAFVISTYAITNDSAQALLKILEEAPIGVTFFLFVPSLFQVPETIISRAYIIESDGTPADTAAYEKIAEIFFKKSVAERFAAIEKLVKGTKEERPLRNRGLMLLCALENYAHVHKIKLPDTFFKTYAFMMQPTSSPKILLESIAGAMK